MNASAEVEEEVKETDSDRDWHLAHSFHLCQPSKGIAIAVCGSRVDLTGHPAGPKDIICAMCMEIRKARVAAKAACPLCGEYYPRSPRWNRD